MGRYVVVTLWDCKELWETDDPEEAGQVLDEACAQSPETHRPYVRLLDQEGHDAVKVTTV